MNVINMTLLRVLMTISLMNDFSGEGGHQDPENLTFITTALILSILMPYFLINTEEVGIDLRYLLLVDKNL